MNESPSILFIISDDHRFGASGALAPWSPGADAGVQTPALDQLAAAGVSFTRAHIMGSMSDAVCAPSRAAILTGVNPLRAAEHYIPVANGLMTLTPGLPLLPQVFREAGHASHGIGKWHNDRESFNRCFASGRHIFLRGMSEHWSPPLHRYDPSGEYGEDTRYAGDGYSSTLFSDAAVDFLDGHDHSRPFFLYLSYTAPHDPRTAPADYAARYRPVDVPLPASFLPEHPFDNGEMAVRDEKLAPWPRTPDIVRRHVADYHAMITHMDHEIGRVLDALERSGQAERTVVVYVADHGLALGQHGLMGKQNLYDHSIRVPLIVRGPGLPAGACVDSLCYSFDLFATLCDLAGIDAPTGLEGRSLLPLVAGREGARDTVFALYDDIQRAVSDGTWKLIRYRRSARRNAGTNRTQLFHLAADPWEMFDLSGDPAHSAHAERLEAALAAWQAEVGDPLLTTGGDPS